MALVLDGTNGVSLVQDGVITSAKIADGTIAAADLAAGAITSGALPAGSVLQVVMDTDSTERTVSNTTFIDSGLSQAITPSSTSSKILVVVSQSGVYSHTSGSQKQYRLLRNSTEIVRIEDVMFDGLADDLGQQIGYSYLDSPATTSEITYKTQFANRGGSQSFSVNHYGSVALSSSLILMEIAG